MHLNDIFYDVSKMSLKTKETICRESQPLAYKWWVDILDCSKSWAREKIDMSLDEILKKLTDSCHFTVIYRRGDPDSRNKEMFKWHLEIGFSTMDSPSHFLWIKLDEKYKDEFITKYKLVEKII